MRQEPANSLERLSRFLTYVLRHRPKEYPASFDAQGFVSWDQVTDLVQSRFPEVTEGDIRPVDRDEKKNRFEAREGKVRATCGPPFPVDLSIEAARPPPILYFGPG